MGPGKILASTLLLPALCFASPGPDSTCTQAAVTVSRSELRELSVAQGAEVLVHGREGSRIAIARAEAFRWLARRKSDPTRAAAATMLEARLRDAFATEPVVEMNAIAPAPSSDLPADELLEAIDLSKEMMKVLETSLLEGQPSITLDGSPVTRLVVEWYEARDPKGDVAGVRFVGEGVKVYERCSVSP